MNYDIRKILGIANTHSGFRRSSGTGVAYCSVLTNYDVLDDATIRTRKSATKIYSGSGTISNMFYGLGSIFFTEDNVVKKMNPVTYDVSTTGVVFNNIPSELSYAVCGDNVIASNMDDEIYVIQGQRVSGATEYASKLPAGMLVYFKGRLWSIKGNVIYQSYPYSYLLYDREDNVRFVPYDVNDAVSTETMAVLSMEGGIAVIDADDNYKEVYELPAYKGSLIPISTLLLGGNSYQDVVLFMCERGIVMVTANGAVEVNTNYTMSRPGVGKASATYDRIIYIYD